MTRTLKNLSLIAFSITLLVGCGMESPRTARSNQNIDYYPTTTMNPFPTTSTTTTMQNIVTSTCTVSVDENSSNLTKIGNVFYAPLESTVRFNVRINAGIGRQITLGRIFGGGSEAALESAETIITNATGNLVFNYEGPETVSATVFERTSTTSPREITCTSANLTVENLKLNFTGARYAAPNAEISLTPVFANGASMSYRLRVENPNGSLASGYSARWEGGRIKVKSTSETTNTVENRELRLKVLPADSSGRILSQFSQTVNIMFLKPLNCRIVGAASLKYQTSSTYNIVAMDDWNRATGEEVVFTGAVGLNNSHEAYRTTTHQTGNTFVLRVDALIPGLPRPNDFQMKVTAKSLLPGGVERTCETSAGITITP